MDFSVEVITMRNQHVLITTEKETHYRCNSSKSLRISKMWKELILSAILFVVIKVYLTFRHHVEFLVLM